MSRPLLRTPNFPRRKLEPGRYRQKFSDGAEILLVRHEDPILRQTFWKVAITRPVSCELPTEHERIADAIDWFCRYDLEHAMPPVNITQKDHEEVAWRLQLLYDQLHQCFIADPSLGEINEMTEQVDEVARLLTVDLRDPEEEEE